MGSCCIEAIVTIFEVCRCIEAIFERCQQELCDGQASLLLVFQIKHVTYVNVLISILMCS